MGFLADASFFFGGLVANRAPRSAASNRRFASLSLNFSSLVFSVMSKEYIIYCDESETKGRKFSNFYGGALVESDHIDEVRQALAAKKIALNLFGEIKWSKITVNYYKKYIDLIDFYFDLIKDGKIKLRIMFTQNARRPSRLTREHIDNQYAILYYHFIRHAFGLIYSPIRQRTRVRIYPDKLPLSAEQAREFKIFVVRLGNRFEFSERGLHFSMQDITEVESHDHDVLQCLDVVLGAMNFRLNKKNKDKPEGQVRRSDKTIAKEKVYKHINRRIRDLYPGYLFNIGVTTGWFAGREDRWNHPYRHWCFTTKRRWR